MSNLRQQSCNEIDLVSGGEKMDPLIRRLGRAHRRPAAMERPNVSFH